MKRSTRTASVALVALVAMGWVAATCRAADPVAPRVPQIKFSDYRLPNGLRVLLSVDHSAPVVAVSVTYDVGSRNERPGRTGFAHLFEHMMFQGSQNVGKGEHMSLIQDNGGTMNGTTNEDRTNYFEELPANQLELALFLEADRMRALDISQVNLDNQRAVVQEEKRQSYDNQPYGGMEEVIQSLAYSNFAYKHTTIGSMDDLNAANIDDVRAFFKTYYVPNNAALAVVGDFNEADAKRKIERYFGVIPRAPQPPPVDMTEQPLTGEQRKTIRDRLARLTRYEAVYKTVPGDSPDFYALSVLGNILSARRTGRLYNAIVEKRIALNVMANAAANRGPGLFRFSATLPPDGSVATLEKALDAEIERVKADGVTEQEMQRAHTQELARAVGAGGGGRFGGGGMQTAIGKANALTQNAILFNDPGRVNTLLPRLEAVTAADVKRVANLYLVKTNRVVVIDVPDAEDDDQFGGN